MRQALRALSRTLLSFRLAVTQRLRRSWTTWLLRRTTQALPRAQRLVQLQQKELQAQLLRTKELAQRQVQLRHRLQELYPTQPEERPLPAMQQMQQALGLPVETPLRALLGQPPLPSGMPPSS